jgi:hypothetical protein
VGLRPRVKRGRDADRLLTAIVSTGNGASSAIYLLGVLDRAQAMRDTQNTEARRPIVRTYEGVQWFKHQTGTESIPAFLKEVWLAAIPGTNMALYRFPVHTIGNLDAHRVSLVIWTGTFWTSSGTEIVKELTDITTTSREFSTVRQASQWASVVRATIVRQRQNLGDIHPSWKLKVVA